MSQPVYLDNAATTPVDPRVFEAMRPYWLDDWGNPSSVYGVGRRARRALDDARDRIAQVLNCRANEIVFTSCGSESDNLAIRGVAMAQAEQHGWKHVVTSRVEHHAVLHACQWLERHLGFEVTYLEVDEYGRVDPAAVLDAVRPDTALVSIMYANNEIGTVQPIAEIARAISQAGRSGALLHTDAVQAGGLLPLDTEALGVDLLALSGHKFYAPKGVGLLFVRRGTPLLHQLSGGGQERGVRAGTENVAYIVGMATALELAYAEKDQRVAHVSRLRDRLIDGVSSAVPGVRLTGHPIERMPNSASFTISGADGESLLLNLDQEGICASSGAACTSGTLEISHVLRALNLPEEEARGSLRLTTGTRTTDGDVVRVLEVLPGIVDRVRELTPGLAS